MFIFLESCYSLLYHKLILISENKGACEYWGSYFSQATNLTWSISSLFGIKNYMNSASEILMLIEIERPCRARAATWILTVEIRFKGNNNTAVYKRVHTDSHPDTLHTRAGTVETRALS